MKNPDTQSKKVILAGHSHIVDDGDCDGHGYFLPKQDTGGLKHVSNSGVDYVDVPPDQLLKALASLREIQRARLTAAQIFPVLEIRPENNYPTAFAAMMYR